MDQNDTTIQQIRDKSGCYIKQDLSMSSEPAQPIMIPLKHINYHIDIINSIASLTLIQTYYNPFDKFLQVQYSFPLDPGSCIYQFTAQFDNKKIQGSVKRKQQAQQYYQKALKQGRQAVYGEINTKRADIMNLYIGNISPLTQVVISISLMQQLLIARSMFYKLLIPSSISPRYINDDRDCIQYKGTTVKLSKKSLFTWNFKITLKTTQKVIFFNSPTHKLQMLSQNKTKTQTLLVMRRQQFPYKDFQFFYTTENYHLPSYAIGCTDYSYTVMLSFIPKFCEMKINDAYCSQVKKQPFETDLNPSRGQYIFILDRSGSMEGLRIKKAKQGLILFLKSLPNNCYFNVVSFGSQYKQIFAENIVYNDKNLQYAIKQIQKMNADMLGTEIQKPLKAVLEKPAKNGFIKQIFLLTDGDVSNANKVIKLVSKNIKYNRVHTIGIGNQASLALIKGCAKQGKGKYIFLSDDCDPSSEIIEMLAQAMSPVINEVRLSFNKEIIESVVPNPNNIPYILKNDVVNFYLTFQGKIKQKQLIRFSYILSGIEYYSTITIQPTDFLNVPFVDKMSHFKVIKNLEKAEKEVSQLSETTLSSKSFYYRHQAINQSIKHNILSQFTAFICVGKQLIDSNYQQFVSKQATIVSILPEYEQKYTQQPVMQYFSMSQHNASQNKYQIEIPNQISYHDTKKKQNGVINTLFQIVGNIFGTCSTNGNIAQQQQFMTKIIHSQRSDGSWISDEIIYEILNLTNYRRKLTELIGCYSKQIVFTYLIVKWIQKYQPSKKYKLIVKKAQSYIKSQCSKNNFNVLKLSQLDTII